MIRRRIAAKGLACAAALFAASALSVPAAADIQPAAHGGFASVNSVIVPATRWQVWEELLHPENWWGQTQSGDPMNLRLTPRAGGCLCETVPVDGSWESGSFEHGRVVALMPQEMLRLTGSLGQLQDDGLAGTLTVRLEDAQGGTRITWEYVVPGASRLEDEQFASQVDRRQQEAFNGFASYINKAASRR